jgi:hypothetical protein
VCASSSTTMSTPAYFLLRALRDLLLCAHDLFVARHRGDNRPCCGPIVGPSSEVSLARTWGPGATRAGKFTVVASTVGRYKAAPMTALIAMDKLLFWLGLGAAQKGAGSKPIERRN